MLYGMGRNRYLWIRMSGILIFLRNLSRIYPFFEMNEDGSVIVYYKEYHSDSPTADLYVKQRGEQPIMVDERVALGFRLF